MDTPTIYDVSRLSGVSTATVSRTFTAPDRVREETRRKVLAAEPIDFAQALLHRKTLIHWKRLLIQPDAPFAPEQIACRT